MNAYPGATAWPGATVITGETAFSPHPSPRGAPYGNDL
jgi:hypothetical protein